MKIFNYFFILLGYTILQSSCSNNDDSFNTNSLAAYLQDKTIETEAVIACAGSAENSNAVLVYFYPKVGAENSRVYETETTEVNKNDFSKYRRVEVEFLPFFNGYLNTTTRNITNEKWLIITYELANEIKISNPIKTKQVTQPTVWSSNVTIDQNTPTMPIFTWLENTLGTNAIYFQVISDMQDNLLSGTYTSDNYFQYYNTSNVVLNITTETPPTLLTNTSYHFTLMDVSQDNWVHRVIQKEFSF